MIDQTSVKRGPQSRGEGSQQFYGKFRGKVLDNMDPLMLGRIIAEVPSVCGGVMNWAMPCVPYAGPDVGFYAIPPIGASVWIEFEGGDPNYPIWVGCYWDEGEVPEVEGPPLPEKKVFKTEFVTMVLNDVPEVGGFTLTCTPLAVDIPLSMTFNSEGITILCPESSITMTPASIDLAIPESVISMTPETISAVCGDMTLTATEAIQASATADISIEAGAAVEVSAAGDVSIEAAGAAEMTAGGDVAVTGGGAAELTGGGDVAVTGGGAAELTGGGDVAVTGGGAAELTGGLDVAVTAGLAVEVTAAADLAITAVGATEITSVGIALTGIVEATPDLLIDGQQPLVI